MEASYSARGEAFVRTDLSYGQPRKIWECTSIWRPTNKRFVVVQADEPQKSSTEQLMLLENFFDELRRRAPTGSR
jgi:hypothetical protein